MDPTRIPPVAMAARVSLKSPKSPLHENRDMRSTYLNCQMHAGRLRRGGKAEPAATPAQDDLGLPAPASGG
jgi:hypothetical protein